MIDGLLNEDLKRNIYFLIKKIIHILICIVSTSLLAIYNYSIYYLPTEKQQIIAIIIEITFFSFLLFKFKK